MVRKTCTAEQIINKLREAEIIKSYTRDLKSLLEESDITERKAFLLPVALATPVPGTAGGALTFLFLYLTRPWAWRVL